MVFRLSKGIEHLHAGAIRGPGVIPYLTGLTIITVVTTCGAPAAAFPGQNLTYAGWNWLASRAALLATHALVMYLTAKRAFHICELAGRNQFLLRFVVLWFLVSARLFLITFIYGFVMTVMLRTAMLAVARTSPNRLDTLAGIWATLQMLDRWLLPLLVLLLWYWLMIKSFQRLAEGGRTPLHNAGISGNQGRP